MNPVEPVLTGTPSAPLSRPSSAVIDRRSLLRFVFTAGALTLAFAPVLWQLGRHAVKTEIASHILLVPFICAYLIKTSKNRITVQSQPSVVPSVVCWLIGAAALSVYWFWARPVMVLRNDRLSMLTFAYLAMLAGVAFATLGWPRLRPHLFPLSFLIFMVPLPSALIDSVNVILQYPSAAVAAVMLRVTGVPLLYSGVNLQIPGLHMVVAEECSGIRSTIVLFMTSLLAGHLFLRTPWKMGLLALAVFPLGILRNAFRIASIAWLTVNVDPDIIHGPLHKRGGPLFFALSLIPLFWLLWRLRKSEAPRE